MRINTKRNLLVLVALCAAILCQPAHADSQAEFKILNPVELKNKFAEISKGSNIIHLFPS